MRDSIEKSILHRSDRNQIKFEVAFFGGSFTAIPNDYMEELLKSVQPYIKGGAVNGIRISTRPDAISEDVLNTLKRYNVTSIELGAQSMDDGVLLVNKRGHTVEDIIRSSDLIKQYGFELGLQMMTGLYGSSYEKDINTGEKIKDICPDTVRIYPTLVMKGTDLERLYISGRYIPYGFDDTVKLCSELLLMFEENNIRVIRLGLHSSDGIKENMLAGVWHPSFREICEEYILTQKIKKTLDEHRRYDEYYYIKVNPKDISKLTGRGNSGIKRLQNMGYNIRIQQDEKVKKGNISFERVDRK